MRLDTCIPHGLLIHCLRRLVAPVILLVLCAPAATCIRAAPMRAPPARLISIAIDPPAVAAGTSRLPTITLTFDRALAPLHPDAVWLVAGAPTDSLRNDAARGGLGATNRARRLDARAELDPDDPTRLRVRPAEPLAPQTPFVLATTARLVSAEGAPAGSATGALEPIVEGFVVAPVRVCPTLARLVFPQREGVPRGVSQIVLAFDRPVQRGEGESVRLLGPSDESIRVDAVLGCPDAAGGYWCAEIRPLEVLAPHALYRVEIGSLTDIESRAIEGVDLAFHTGEQFNALPVAPSAPLPCAVDEFARPPFCARVRASALEVRGATLEPGALRIDAGGFMAQSPVGTSHWVRLERLPPGDEISLTVWTVALDGTLSYRFDLYPLPAPPRTSHVRITEVLARPFSSSAQEFVEILNDDERPAELEGLVLATPSGASVLPALSLAPGARALVVGAAFDPRGEPRAGDPPAAPGSILVRLPGSIASRGLSDRGSDVWLADREGHIMSRVPSGEISRAPRQGVSLVRADPRMHEDDPAAWTYDAAGSSTPGLPDRVP